MNIPSNFSDAFAMGSHGAYVWLSYGLGLVLLGWNAALPWLARRRYIKKQARRLHREAAR